MSRLLLIYDPSKNYTESFEHRLKTLGIDIYRVQDSVECLHALLHMAPDFLLLAPENDSLAFERLLKMLGPRGEADRGVARLELHGERLGRARAQWASGEQEQGRSGGKKGLIQHH